MDYHDSNAIRNSASSIRSHSCYIRISENMLWLHESTLHRLTHRDCDDNFSGTPHVEALCESVFESCLW
jgi:hypothetical protein